MGETGLTPNKDMNETVIVNRSVQEFMDVMTEEVVIIRLIRCSAS